MSFTEVATIKASSEPGYLIWRPHSRELWYEVGNDLQIWPSHRHIHLPHPQFHIVSFSPSGSKMFLSDSEAPAASEYDLRTQKWTRLRGEVSSASWEREKLWWIQDQHEGKERQWLCTAKSRRLLPSKWWIGAFEVSNGLAIARERDRISAAAILHLDIHSGKVKLFKRLKDVSEYPGCDGVDWNRRLNLGIATYSGDTGGATCSMEVFSAHSLKRLPDYAFVESGPDWFGSQVAVDLRDFEDIGPHTSGSDTYSIVLLNPRTMRRQVIAKRVVKFLPWKTPQQIDESERARAEAPRLGALAVSPESFIAYVSGAKTSWQIHILKRK